MNYWAQADGSLEKRAGIVKVVEVAGDQKITMLENFQDHLVFAYGTTVASVYLPTLAVTTHKSDFLTSDPFRGVADGNYFYFCNGSTQIQYLTFAADGVELIDPAAWVRSGTADFSIIPPQEWLRLETSLVSGKYVIYYTSGETGAWAVGNTVSDGTNSATIASYTSYGSGYSRFSVTAGTWAGPGTELGASLTNTTTGGTATRNGDPSVADAIYIAYQPITVEVNAKYQVQYKLTDYTDKEKLYFYSAFDQTDLIVTGIGITQTHILNAITDGLSSFYVRYDPGAAKEDINITEFSVQKMDTATLTLKGDLSGSPRCKVLYGAASRLFAGNIIGHEGRLKYSGLNDGTTPPYTSWTDSTTPGAAGQVDNTMLGDVVDIKSIGTQVVILYEQGKSGFRIDETGATKLNLIDYSVKDAGAVGKACATPLGIVYMNSKGIWAVSPGAASNIPYSDFQMSFSKNLGSFEDYDFTDSDIAYYPLKRSILITCKYGTDSGNNRVLVYNLDTQGWSMLDLELSRFYIDADNAYGGSSTQTKIFELFSGTSDDGEAIESNFEQELSVGDLHTRKDMLRQWVSATLDTGSNVGVNFDIYNTDGTLEEDAVTMSLNEDFEGGANVIRNFQRIILKIRDISELGHTIHWVKIDTREKTPIRNRGLSAGDLFQLVAGSVTIGNTATYSTSNPCGGATWRGQTFLTDSDTDSITQVSLNLAFFAGASGDFNVEIFATVAGLPTGSALGTKTINNDDLLTGWNDFTFSSAITVSPSTTYAIVISQPSYADDSGREVYGTSTSLYSDGRQIYSSNSGSTWGLTAAQYDLSFQVCESGTYYIVTDEDDNIII